MEVEIRQRSFGLREQEIDRQMRERERGLSETRDHLLFLSKALSREQAHNESLRNNVADLARLLEQSRGHIASLITGTIMRSRRPRKVYEAKSSLAAVGSRRKQPIGRSGPTPLKRVQN